jgi:hypothetical protein
MREFKSVSLAFYLEFRWLKFGLISFYLESRRLARRGGSGTEEKSGRQMNRRPHPSCV